LVSAAVVLSGRLEVPPDGLGVVLRDAVAPAVHHAEVVLRVGEPLRRGGPNPLSRFGVVALNSSTGAQHHAVGVLGLSVSQFGRPPIPPRGYGAVLGDSVTFFVLLSRGEEHRRV
jgi:hypothetical protein